MEKLTYDKAMPMCAQECMAAKINELVDHVNQPPDTPETTESPVLWSGEWPAESITIPGISEWRVLQIVVQSGHVLAFVSSSVIQGVGISISSKNHKTLAVRIALDGDTCTLETSHSINHTENDGHGTRSDHAVTKIIGLIKA